jgi:pimeloyl-ACP methyl ester carboxylesterase
MFHGFTGQRNEMDIVGGTETMYGRTARIFAEQGYASLRIDFIGSGESDGKWENTTVSGQINDALAAIEYVKTLDRVDADRIALLGLSQGGMVAACTAGRSDDVDAVILWSAVSVPQFIYSNLLGQDNVVEALKSDNPEELIVGTLPWGATTTLKANFYQDLFLLSPSAEITSYEGPLQVTVGLMDTIVYPQPYAGQIFLQYHEGSEELVIMDDADHMLNIFTGDSSVLDRAISNALDFLKLNI